MVSTRERPIAARLSRAGNQPRRPSASNQVVAAARERADCGSVSDLHPAYCSLLINFDMLKLNHDELEDSSAPPYLGRLEEPSAGAATSGNSSLLWGDLRPGLERCVRCVANYSSSKRSSYRYRSRTSFIFWDSFPVLHIWASCRNHWMVPRLAVPHAELCHQVASELPGTKQVFILLLRRVDGD